MLTCEISLYQCKHFRLKNKVIVNLKIGILPKINLTLKYEVDKKGAFVLNSDVCLATKRKKKQ